MCAAAKKNGKTATRRADQCQVHGNSRPISTGAKGVSVILRACELILRGLWASLEPYFKIEGLTRMVEKRLKSPGTGGLQGRHICSTRPIWSQCTAAHIIYSPPASRHEPKSFGLPLDYFSIIILILIRPRNRMHYTLTERCRANLRAPRSVPTPSWLTW
jgi:hypothetical protein